MGKRDLEFTRFGPHWQKVAVFQTGRPLSGLSDITVLIISKKGRLFLHENKASQTHCAREHDEYLYSSDSPPILNKRMIAPGLAGDD